MKGLLIITLLIISCFGFSQNNISEYTEFKDFSKFYNLGKFDEAEASIIKLRYHIKESSIEDIFAINSNLIMLYNTLYDFVKSDSLIKQNNSLIIKHPDLISKKQKGYFEIRIAMRYVNSKDYPKAITIFNNSLINTINTEDSIEIFLSISNCYMRLHRSDSAINTLIKITKKSKDDWNLTHSHHLLSSIYLTDYFDFKKASYHFYKSIKYAEKYPLSIASFYGEYGQLLSFKYGKHEEAIQYLEKSLNYIKENVEDPNNSYYGVTYSILARVNHALGNHDKAIDLLLKSNKTNISQILKNSNQLLILITKGENNKEDALNSIKIILYNLSKNDKLENYQHNITELFNTKNWLTSNDLNTLFNIDSIKNNYNPVFLNLLYEYQYKTFHENLYNETNDVINTILRINKYNDNFSYVEQIITQLPKNNLYKTLLLNKAYSLQKENKNKYSINLFKLVEKEYYNISSPYCNEIARRFLSLSLASNNQLNEKYESIENLKTNNLSVQLKKLQAKQNKTIPVKLAITENNILQELNEKYQFLEENSSQKDKEIITNEIINLKEKLNEVRLNMELEFPKYYHYISNNLKITIPSIQNSINNEEIVIEHFIHDTIINAFILTKTDYILVQTKIDSTFTKNLALLRKTTSDYTYITQNPQKAWEEYTNSAKYLYDKLFPPKARELLKGKSHIYVIPDGELNTISFEALLKEKPKTSERDYKNLAYLINDFDISYAYSATLLFKTKDFRTPTKEKLLTYGGFAPEYDKNLLAKAEELENFRAFRSNPSVLANNKHEVNAIAKLLSGDKFFSLQANEKNFKENAGKYKILHLAMHALTDDEDPLYSKFLFTNTKGDSLEDNYLNAY